jgi:hypothetical protein
LNTTDFELKFKNRSGLDFDLNSKELAYFDLIQRFTMTARVQMTQLTSRMLQPSPITRNLIPRLRAQKGVIEERLQTHITAVGENPIIGVEEFINLPCRFFFEMVAPLNLEEVNHPSPHDPILLT